MQAKIRSLVNSKTFNNFILCIVILDMMFMGLEELYANSTLTMIQHSITSIYIFELALRWIGRESKAAYRKDRRNLFDLAIIALRVIPEFGPLALLKLYRSSLVMGLYTKINIHVHSVINKFYLQNIKQLNY